jgi:3-oxoacyl-[acyl-carrier-protein] synthase II
MVSAIENARLSPNDISYINAHSTSTPVGDVAEVTAIKRVFSSLPSQRSNTLYLSSLKGSLGHLLGAAGAVESVLTILACKERVIPPAINIETLDPELKLEEASYLKIVQNEKLVLSDDGESNSRFVALKNSFGFGGTNASICFSSYS